MSQTREKRMISAVISAIDPQKIQINDESNRHVGHAGAQPEGETHYKLYVVARAVEGMNAVARHRKINTILANEFESGLHALNITARTPEEEAALN